MKHYIAAGFDPARFWDLTLRLYVLEMEGAAERTRNERAMVWWGAMMPHMKKPPDFEKFVGIPPDRNERIRRWVEAWDRADASLRRH